MRTMKKIILPIIFLLVLVLLGFGGFFFLRYLQTPPPEPEPVIARVTAQGQSSYHICVDEKDRSAAAAARYLAHALREKTGAELSLAAPSEEDAGPSITLCTDSSEAMTQPFTIALDDSANVVFRFSASDQTFACAKAVIDRWLRDDCGLQGDALVLDEELIQSGFSGLSFALDGTLRIMSQNIRYTDDPDGNSIAERAPRFAQLVAQYEPDIICMQEVTEEWSRILQADYSASYEIYGCTQYGHASTEGSANSLLFRRDRFLFLNGGTFWLSQTPDKESSMLDYVGLPRICTWVLLKDLQTGRLFYVENAHLHNGSGAGASQVRRNQVQILSSYMTSQYARLGDYPVFLVGDFNTVPTDELFLDLIQSYRVSMQEALMNTSDVDYTFHNYGRSKKLLDFCFCQGGPMTVLHYRIADDMYDGFVSDHYAVITDAYLY